ncbi:type I-C CRISPR-associated protein Cas8c/Csd1 [Acidovorax sp. SUPP2522]|uniref:type I-C CRISPR-associated protein Cas8c/Csd1 n=1 Tax=unclassified Acidovorax TaxID=2684926 RepID=UPI00234ADCFC|nr:MULTISPECIES: type I-C CRISPR-associated protein Cas8c/Csd1 [unclassified Acidovorax]WCM96874.1 type I-C CRISPR-associated protein Cas8c/Csd1 [Acidovorax sp. GBBC 1281]GKT14950.1 type I-C CRISPR-associated protein Cas8c/Csd1 [Acidovorax sp. SUPP2522]
MILQALNTYYQRLLARGEEGLSPFGYSPEKISYEILLAPDGRVVDVNDIRDTSGKKPLPRPMNVPQPEKRTVGIKSNFLWDKTSYVLGASATSKRADKEHEAFKALHQESLAGTEDAGLKALLGFLSSWTPERFAEAPFTPEMLDANVVFRLDGERTHLHERPAAQTVRARLLGSEDAAPHALAHCLVTGEQLPVARLHPAIKGVNGAQSSGASIVSFNLESFTSYGKSQGENAPVSEQAAFAYTTVLNHLLRRGEHNRQRIQIGDASVVFWAEADDADQAQEAELTFESLLNAPPDDSQEAARVREVLEQIAKGRPLSELNPKLQDGTRMFVLGLAPNASRISIRFWEAGTLGCFAQRLAQHERDFRIEPLPWKIAPSVDRVTLETAPARWNQQKKRYEAEKQHIPPHLAGEILRAVLTGRLYPRSLLANTLMRMRSDGNLSGLRAAICKGILAREQRLDIHTHIHKEEVPVSLDKQSLNPGYLLGRLFAVLEAVQRNALGGQINATIRDRYYGAASATPASVFSLLLRNTQNHMGKLRKDKPKLAGFFEREIGEIVGGLSDHFPRYLPLEDQGRFAIGYYHQSQSRSVKGEPGTDTDISDNDPEGAPA